MKRWFLTCHPVVLVFVSLTLTILFLATRDVFAAQDRAIASPDRLESVTARPAIDLNGTVHAFLLRATFQAIDAKPSGEITATQIGAVEVDLLKSNGSVVVDGTQYDDREIADILMAVAQREWQRANPGPLPQRRRALRSTK